MKQIDKTIISERAKESVDMVQAGTNCKVFLVGTEDVPAIWDHVVPFLESSQNDQREMSIEDFFESIMNEEMHLWISIEDKELIACMISQIATYPQKKVLRIIFVGGEGMEKWIGFMSHVENFALINGCTSLEVWGRKGWLKILKDWECKYHILTKDLTGRMH